MSSGSTWLRAGIGALLLAACLGGGAGAQDLSGKFDPARDAARDLAAAQAQASMQGKRVIVDVGGEWCVWCHIMDRFLAFDPELRRLRDRSYVWVKVNYSQENPNTALLSRFPPVAGYPHLFVLDAGGKLLHSQDTSELEEGRGYSRERFRAFLLRWVRASSA
ncbi:MAG: thioredoxin family protein [Casimicrobiaceae bacterium]